MWREGEGVWRGREGVWRDGEGVFHVFNHLQVPYVGQPFTMSPNPPLKPD